MKNKTSFPLRKVTLASISVTAAFIILAMITVFGVSFLVPPESTNPDSPNIIGQVFGSLGKMFFSPQAKHFTVLDGIYNIFVTLCLGFLTTIFGAIFGLLGGIAAARNLSHPAVSCIVRGIAAFVRAVPTVLWVLIFAIGAGLGSVAAVVGMTFHSFSYLVKAYSESFEEIDSGTIEALKASGAGWPAIISQAVIPSSLGQLVSWTFLRFEINFTNAVAMGAAAGAGGIGYDLFMASSFYINIGEVGTVSWLILAVAVFLEIGAINLKQYNHVIQ